jgi:hypothetical protein
LNTQGNVVTSQHKFATKSEWDLIQSVQGGDKQAYNRLYQEYIGKVYGLCYRLIGEKCWLRTQRKKCLFSYGKKLIIIKVTVNFQPGCMQSHLTSLYLYAKTKRMVEENV